MTTRDELEAMGGLDKCPFCNGKHATKKSANACSQDRRRSFAELDAAMAKLTAPKKPKP